MDSKELKTRGGRANLRNKEKTNGLVRAKNIGRDGPKKRKQMD